jgi:trans-2,3-dihydro-3-hydroxyanthranilate isomerase
MIPLRNPKALRKAHIDIPAYQELRSKSDFFSPHLFCIGGLTQAGDTFARHLDIPPDITEDPFTGSATGGMAAYLWHYGLIDEPQFVAEQGHWLGRPGEARVEIIGPPHDIQSVKVGGKAAGILHGELTLP